MTTTNLNVPPYFDDHDESKNFLKILFKPGYSVQARELTQLQTLLQEQITRFGNHIFQNGSVVIPGNSFADIGVDFIDFTSTADINSFNGKIIVGQNTGVKAVVKHVVMSPTAPYYRFFIGYISGGTFNQSVFGSAEPVYVESNPLITAVVVDGTQGLGALANVATGVYYINGNFVRVAQQTIVAGYDLVPSCKIVLSVKNSIVDSQSDETLLDPSQGSYNYAAPGADRQRVELILTKYNIDDDTSSTEDYIELMRYRAGSLESHNKYAKYSELEKNLARRTYDESGNYIVDGFNYKIVDNLRTQYNDGISTTGSRDLYSVKVDPGKAYIRGFEIEKLSESVITAPKARTADHIKASSFEVKKVYGNYIHISNIKRLPDVTKRQQITFYNDSDTNNTSAVIVGTARALGVDFINSGVADTNQSIYKLYLFDVDMADKPGGGSYQMSDIGCYKFGTAGSATVLHQYSAPNAFGDFVYGNIISAAGGTRVATVHEYNRTLGVIYAFKHSDTLAIPVLGDYVVSGLKNTTLTGITSIVVRQDLPLAVLPASVVQSTKTPDNLVDTEYRVWSAFSIATDSSGNGSYSIPAGTFVQPENGTISVFSATGIVSLSLISLTATNTISITGGPVSQVINFVAQVVREAVVPKTKTLTTRILTAIPPTNKITLDRTDIFKIVSITAAGVDVTDRYKLDNGQRDFYYGLGSLQLTGIQPLSNLTIEFQYFEHAGSADYFSVDSYVGLKSTPLANDHIEVIPTYTSANTGRSYSLGSVLDFRPTVSTTGSFANISSNSLVDDSFISSSYKEFVARFDTLYVNKDGNIKIASGIPAIRPSLPAVPLDTIEIMSMLILPYTFSVEDINAKYAGNTRYTMKDIKTLEQRVSELEAFSTLNSMESATISVDVIDSETGLNRFKNGYIVDNFTNPFIIADNFSSGYFASNVKNQLTTIEESIESYPALETTSANYMQVGEMVSLPYYESVLAEQPYSSRATPINPFRVFTWQGVVELIPAIETWSDITNLTTIKNQFTETITETVYVAPAPVASPPVVAPPAPAPVVPAPPVVPVVPAGPTQLVFITVNGAEPNTVVTSNEATVLLSEVGDYVIQYWSSKPANRNFYVNNISNISAIKVTGAPQSHVLKLDIISEPSGQSITGMLKILFIAANQNDHTVKFEGNWVINTKSVTTTTKVPDPVDSGTIMQLALLRDLGYVEPGSPLWNEVISFSVPAGPHAAALQAIAALSDPISRWSTAIIKGNAFFNNSPDKNSILSRYTGIKSSPYSTSDIISYWTQQPGFNGGGYNY